MINGIFHLNYDVESANNGELDKHSMNNFELGPKSFVIHSEEKQSFCFAIHHE